MRVDIEPKPDQWPAERGVVISVTIRSFKGRRDVVAHLFRPDPVTGEPDPALDNSAVIVPDSTETGDGRTVYLETFTEDEAKALVQYLADRYDSRLTHIRASWIPLPVPPGLTPLSRCQCTQTVGRIQFDKIPNYSLSFSVHGLYDLALHPPLTSHDV
ncbi:MAG: hypothetical protein EOM25_12155 [Deltaproteobacteria bacterium]|nr:hypothetical protein [Deltaproteobacteria bacterium]